MIEKISVKDNDVRWNAGMTMLWSVVIVFATYFLIPKLIFKACAALFGVPLATVMDVEKMPNIGLATSIISSLVGVLMIFGVIRLKEGSRISQYLPFRRVPVLDFVKWLALGLVVMFGSGWFLQALGFEPSKGMNGYLSDDTSKPLTLIAWVLVAPVVEELCVRGFMLAGLERVGHPAAEIFAVFLTALAWAALHGQYFAHEMLQLFLFGAVLGFARLKTKSLVTPILMHVVNNLLATSVLLF